MKNFEEYNRTDLACEKIIPKAEDGEESGVIYSESEESGVLISRLEVISEKGQEAIGKPMGKYITLFCGNIWQFEEDQFEGVATVIADEIRRLTDEILGRETKEDCTLLVVGLGNQYITADAIGPQTVKQITVTRHIREMDSELFSKMNCCAISAITPGVLGQTGIEAVELIRGAAKDVSPDLVIVVDALAARSCERLASTIQLSDTGINPGSGIGNMRKTINSETIGFPVVALGVPTVVDSSTLVYDALQKAGIENISDELKTVLNNGRGFYVSPKESDIITKEIAKLLSTAINRAFYAEFSCMTG